MRTTPTFENFLSLSAWHYLRKRALTKVVSLLGAFTFLFPSLTWAFQAQAQPVGSVLLNSQAVKISESHGRIVESFQGRSQLVVYIQDLHCNYEVQTNIARIIDGLVSKFGLLLVAVEGNAAPVATQYFRSYPDKKVQEATAHYFVREGEITGPELYAITGKKPIALEGIEDAGLYQANHETVLQLLSDESQGYVLDVREMLRELKDSIYNQALQNVDAKKTAFRESQLSLFKYCAWLQDFARKQNIDPAATPNLKLYLAQRTGSFPANLESDQLFEELDALDRQVRAGLYTSAAQQELDELEQRLDVVEKLINISATPPELAEFRRQPQAFKAAVFQEYIERHKQGKLLEWNTDFSVLDTCLERVREFYQTADKRSAAFVDNVQGQMARHQTPICVLVTGGYHAQEILTELKARNISYLSVKPRLTREDVLNPYYTRLKGGKTALEKLLAQNQNIFAPSSKLTEVFHPVWDAATGIIQTARVVASSLSETKAQSAVGLRLKGLWARLRPGVVFSAPQVAQQTVVDTRKDMAVFPLPWDGRMAVVYPKDSDLDIQTPALTVIQTPDQNIALVDSDTGALAADQIQERQGIAGRSGGSSLVLMAGFMGRIFGLMNQTVAWVRTAMPRGSVSMQGMFWQKGLVGTATMLAVTFIYRLSQAATQVTYTVVKGDWLYYIAKRLGTTVETMQSLNPDVIPNIQLIRPGQKLIMDVENLEQVGSAGLHAQGDVVQETVEFAVEKIAGQPVADAVQTSLGLETGQTGFMENLTSWWTQAIHQNWLTIALLVVSAIGLAVLGWRVWRARSRARAIEAEFRDYLNVPSAPSKALPVSQSTKDEPTQSADVFNTDVFSDPVKRAESLAAMYEQLRQSQDPAVLPKLLAAYYQAVRNGHFSDRTERMVVLANLLAMASFQPDYAPLVNPENGKAVCVSPRLFDVLFATVLRPDQTANRHLALKEIAACAQLSLALHGPEHVMSLRMETPAILDTARVIVASSQAHAMIQALDLTQNRITRNLALADTKEAEEAWDLFYRSLSQAQSITAWEAVLDEYQAALQEHAFSDSKHAFAVLGNLVFYAYQNPNWNEKRPSIQTQYESRVTQLLLAYPDLLLTNPGLARRHWPRIISLVQDAQDPALLENSLRLFYRSWQTSVFSSRNQGLAVLADLLLAAYQNPAFYTLDAPAGESPRNWVGRLFQQCIYLPNRSTTLRPLTWQEMTASLALAKAIADPQEADRLRAMPRSVVECARQIAVQAVADERFRQLDLNANRIRRLLKSPDSQTAASGWDELYSLAQTAQNIGVWRALLNDFAEAIEQREFASQEQAAGVLVNLTASFLMNSNVKKRGVTMERIRAEYDAVLFDMGWSENALVNSTTVESVWVAAQAAAGLLPTNNFLDNPEAIALLNSLPADMKLVATMAGLKAGLQTLESASAEAVQEEKAEDDQAQADTVSLALANQPINMSYTELFSNAENRQQHLPQVCAILRASGNPDMLQEVLGACAEALIQKQIPEQEVLVILANILAAAYAHAAQGDASRPEESPLLADAISTILQDFFFNRIVQASKKRLPLTAEQVSACRMLAQATQGRAQVLHLRMANDRVLENARALLAQPGLDPVFQTVDLKSNRFGMLFKAAKAEETQQVWQDLYDAILVSEGKNTLRELLDEYAEAVRQRLFDSTTAMALMLNILMYALKNTGWEYDTAGEKADAIHVLYSTKIIKEFKNKKLLTVWDAVAVAHGLVQLDESRDVEKTQAITSLISQIPGDAPLHPDLDELRSSDVRPSSAFAGGMRTAAAGGRSRAGVLGAPLLWLKNIALGSLPALLLLLNSIHSGQFNMAQIAVLFAAWVAGIAAVVWGHEEGHRTEMGPGARTVVRGQGIFTLPPEGKSLTARQVAAGADFLNRYTLLVVAIAVLSGILLYGVWGNVFTVAAIMVVCHAVFINLTSRWWGDREVLQDLIRFNKPLLMRQKWYDRWFPGWQRQRIQNQLPGLRGFYATWEDERMQQFIQDVLKQREVKIKLILLVYENFLQTSADLRHDLQHLDEADDKTLDRLLDEVLEITPGASWGLTQDGKMRIPRAVLVAALNDYFGMVSSENAVGKQGRMVLADMAQLLGRHYFRGGSWIMDRELATDPPETGEFPEETQTPEEGYNGQATRIAIAPAELVTTVLRMVRFSENQRGARGNARQAESELETALQSWRDKGGVSSLDSLLHELGREEAPGLVSGMVRDMAQQAQALAKTNTQKAVVEGGVVAAVLSLLHPKETQALEASVANTVVEEVQILAVAPNVILALQRLLQEELSQTTHAEARKRIKLYLAMLDRLSAQDTQHGMSLNLDQDGRTFVSEIQSAQRALLPTAEEIISLGQDVRSTLFAQMGGVKAAEIEGRMAMQPMIRQFAGFAKDPAKALEDAQAQGTVTLFQGSLDKPNLKGRWGLMDAIAFAQLGLARLHLLPARVCQTVFERIFRRHPEIFVRRTLAKINARARRLAEAGHPASPLLADMRQQLQDILEGKTDNPLGIGLSQAAHASTPRDRAELAKVLIRQIYNREDRFRQMRETARQREQAGELAEAQALRERAAQLETEFNQTLSGDLLSFAPLFAEQNTIPTAVIATKGFGKTADKFSIPLALLETKRSMGSLGYLVDKLRQDGWDIDQNTLKKFKRRELRMSASA